MNKFGLMNWFVVRGSAGFTEALLGTFSPGLAVARPELSAP
jgi:hypothetical protein